MKYMSDERGWAIPLALIVLVVLAFLGTAVWQYGINGINLVQKSESESRAHYIARSGAEATVAYIFSDNIAANIETRVSNLRSRTSTANSIRIDGVTISGASVSVTSPSNNDEIIITSTATDNQVTAQVKRRLYRSPNLLAVGDSGSILSFNGTNWTRRVNSSGGNWTTNDLNGIGTRGTSGTGEVVVAVGDGGTIISSKDGVTWTNRSSGTTQQLNAVAWGTLGASNRYVAVGNGGDVCTSTDGITWTKQTLSGGPQLNGVAFGTISGTDMFMAVGDNGVVLQSTDGTTWTPRSRTTTGGFNTNDYDFNEVCFGNNMFLAVSDVKYNYYLWATSTGGNWTPRYQYNVSFSGATPELQCVGYSSVAKYFLAAGDNGWLVQFNNNGTYNQDQRDNNFTLTILGSTFDGRYGWGVGHGQKIGRYDLLNFDSNRSEVVTVYNLPTSYNLNDISCITSTSTAGIWNRDTMQW